MTDLTDLTLAAALDGLKSKQFSSVEITQAFLSAMEKARILNAYVVETPEKALEMAKASDARLAKGEGGRLEGAPLGIKDLYCTKGVRTTAVDNVTRSPSRSLSRLISALFISTTLRPPLTPRKRSSSV